MSAFELGQRVRMTGTTVKYRSGYRPMLTHYVEAPLPSTGVYGSSDTYSEGVIVGKRTMQGGKTYPSEADYERNFVSDPASRCEVWLVAFHLRRKPVMCTADQLEVAP